jgi:hypothetical protein
MTIRRTTALLLAVLLGGAVAAMMIWAEPPCLVLVRLPDDFSGRTIMKDDSREPIPTDNAEVVFFPPGDDGVVRTTEPDPVPPPKATTPRPPDPLHQNRTTGRGRGR